MFFNTGSEVMGVHCNSRQWNCPAHSLFTFSCFCLQHLYLYKWISRYQPSTRLNSCLCTDLSERSCPRLCSQALNPWNPVLDGVLSKMDVWGCKYYHRFRRITTNRRNKEVLKGKSSHVPPAVRNYPNVTFHCHVNHSKLLFKCLNVTKRSRNNT